MGRATKLIVVALAELLVAPAAALCALERRLSPQGDAFFSLCTQALAVVPGPPGVLLRLAFYRLTLDEAARSFYVGFGAYFTHRRVVIEEDAFVGAYALVGCARLRRGCLVGSRASLLSGPQLHERDSTGRWGPADLGRARQIDIGEFAWIGEGATVMADIGRSAMVAAGAVVSTDVPAMVMVGGNPARFLRRLDPGDKDEVDAHAHTAPALH